MNYIITTLAHNANFIKEVFGNETPVRVKSYLGNTIDDLQQGDNVIGHLPIQAAAKIIKTGANYWHLSVPGGFRGRLWHIDELRKHATITNYTIYKGAVK